MSAENLNLTPEAVLMDILRLAIKERIATIADREEKLLAHITSTHSRLDSDGRLRPSGQPERACHICQSRSGALTSMRRFLADYEKHLAIMEEQNCPVLSIRIGEGGFSFLQRVFRQQIESGQPVVINTGSMYYSYQYLPQDQNFIDGLTHIIGNDDETRNKFLAIARQFRLRQAITECGYERLPDGSVRKK